MAARLRLALLACASLAACSGEQSAPEGEAYDVGAEVDRDGFHAATPATAETNAEAGAALDLTNEQDFIDARRGLVASEPELEIRDADGDLVWRPADYAFLEALESAAVNPSLLRQARLNSIHGLFEVTDGVWQVRGYDLSNMSVIEGVTGWIIVDPLASVETARAAMALVNRELGERPVTAVIYTHSHIDHFGGVEGVASRRALASGDIEIVAPQGFIEAVADENVLGGQVMGRRAGYMYGFHLPRSPRGHIDSGLGKSPALGSYSIARPTRLVSQTGERAVIDGVEFVFQFAPDTEAPATLTFHLPEHRAWNGGDIVARTMHNLYTLRGAKVRDAIRWSDAIEEARVLFAAETDVAFNGHTWPVFGQEEVDAFLRRQSDVYRYIHDQTLRLANAGLTPDEIAEAIELPDVLAQDFSERGYYGTLKHNARAIYQHYFGWFDAVPANLDPLPPEDAAARYVEAMGGLNAVLDRAEAAFEGGEHRWGAELAQTAVFADPRSARAREILARHYEQLGYRAESAPWRDIYLTGALEAREGPQGADISARSAGLLEVIPLQQFFAAMASRIDGIEAAERDLTFGFYFREPDGSVEVWTVSLSNGVMRYAEGPPPVDEADATVTVTRAFWLRMMAGEAGLADLLASREFSIDGDRIALLGFFGLMEDGDPGFAVVEP
ncbi:MAG: MBL fold metallo-hydrolase [Alphaproteobacteria bacterium]|nr:MBL fold metallo-hydrolase [Alphaproteobacteria bacterium]